MGKLVVGPRYRHNRKTCPCCCGSGIQTRCDGIRIICPACNGTGYIRETCSPRWPRPIGPYEVPPMEPWERDPDNTWEPFDYKLPRVIC